MALVRSSSLVPPPLSPLSPDPDPEPPPPSAFASDLLTRKFSHDRSTIMSLNLSYLWLLFFFDSLPTESMAPQRTRCSNLLSTLSKKLVPEHEPLLLLRTPPYHPNLSLSSPVSLLLSSLKSPSSKSSLERPINLHLVPPVDASPMKNLKICDKKLNNSNPSLFHCGNGISLVKVIMIVTEHELTPLQRGNGAVSGEMLLLHLSRCANLNPNILWAWSNRRSYSLSPLRVLYCGPPPNQVKTTHALNSPFVLTKCNVTGTSWKLLLSKSSLGERLNPPYSICFRVVAISANIIFKSIRVKGSRCYAENYLILTVLESDIQVSFLLLNLVRSKFSGFSNPATRMSYFLSSRISIFSDSNPRTSLTVSTRLDGMGRFQKSQSKVTKLSWLSGFATSFIPTHQEIVFDSQSYNYLKFYALVLNGFMLYGLIGCNLVT